MAVKSGYPETHYGSFEAEDNSTELLPARRYGQHAAWYASSAAYESQKNKAALVPWLLFNRHLWEEKAEALPGGAESLNLMVPHAARRGDTFRGWYVRLKLSEELEVEGIEAVSTDDESAPASEGFELLLEGPLPPLEAAPNRQQRRLFKGLLTVCLSASLAGGTLFLSGKDGENELEYGLLRTELAGLSGHERSLRGRLSEVRKLGLAPNRAARLLMDAMWFDAQFEWGGQYVLWDDEQSQPLGLDCDVEQTEGNREGWRRCHWNET